MRNENIRLHDVAQSRNDIHAVALGLCRNERRDSRHERRTGDTMKKITLLAAAAVFAFGIAAANAQGTGASGGSPGTGTEKSMKNAEQPGTKAPGTTMQAPAPAPSGTTAAAPKEGKTGDAVTTTNTKDAKKP